MLVPELLNYSNLVPELLLMGTLLVNVSMFIKFL
jgi:hypothetical protein